MIQNQNSNLIISYNTMRKAVGWIGILLPFVLLFGNLIINKLNVLNNSWFVKTDCNSIYEANGSFKSSISHFYYSTVGELFTGALCAVALFMFCYKGHIKRKADIGLSDSLMTNLAAVFALGVVVFPTSSDNCITDNLQTFISSKNTGYIHFVFAALFFITLSFISILNFRRTKNISEFGKMPSHNIYRNCGYVMLTCIVMLFIYSTFIEKKEIHWLNSINPVFILETIALIAFGISWLTKGKVDYNYLNKKFKQLQKSI